MLTPKQNFLETIHGGKPDRFVKQYEFMKLIRTPIWNHRNQPKRGEMNKVNNWGVTVSFGEDQPGAFPVHKPDTIVCPDVEEWQETVHAPVLDYPAAEWEACLAEVEKIDRNEYFVAPMYAPGIFEQCHYLMEIKNCLMAFYEDPEDMHDLIKYITEWELKVAEQTCDHIHPDAMFHHDDWGTQISTFLSPDMWAEFYLEPYKELYGYWKERGVEVIVHHSDSYAETLVPYMAEIGIDVWQGTMTTNDINKIEDEWGSKVTCMGGIDSAVLDKADWTKEEVHDYVISQCDKYGNNGHYYIPCLTQGGPGSTFPGVYDEVNKVLDDYSPIYWKEHGLA